MRKIPSMNSLRAFHAHRANAHLDGDTADQTDGLGLGLRIVSRMAPEARRMLLGLPTNHNRTGLPPPRPPCCAAARRV